MLWELDDLWQEIFERVYASAWLHRIRDEAQALLAAIDETDRQYAKQVGLVA